MALWSVSSALVQRRTTSGLFFTACCVAAVHCSSIIGVGNYCADWTDSVTHACVTCNEQQQQQRCIAPSAYGSAYACSRFAPLAGSASPVGVHISPILHYTANCGLWCADQSSRNTRATFLFSGVPHDGVCRVDDTSPERACGHWPFCRLTGERHHRRETVPFPSVNSGMTFTLCQGIR